MCTTFIVCTVLWYLRIDIWYTYLFIMLCYSIRHSMLLLIYLKSVDYIIWIFLLITFCNLKYYYVISFMSIIFRFTILINILLKKLCLLRYGINGILSGLFIFNVLYYWLWITTIQGDFFIVNRLSFFYHFFNDKKITYYTYS